ncbi:MAG: hypothetical protein ACI865_000691 [Flavobacteriaceae bacterium]|jgi:hypothetical protein
MKILFTLLLFISADVCHSQRDFSNAPSASGDAVTVGQGTFQIESQFQIRVSGKAFEFDLPSNLLIAGIGNNFELRMTNGLTLIQSNFQALPISLGCKTQLINRSELNTQIALLFDTELPLFGNDNYVTSAALALNHSFSPRNAIGVTIGTSHSSLLKRSTEQDKTSSVNLTFVYGYTIHPKLTLFSNVSGSLERTTSSIENPYTLDLGCLYMLSSSIELSLSSGTELTSSIVYHSVGFNFNIQ